MRHVLLLIVMSTWFAGCSQAQQILGATPTEPTPPTTPPTLSPLVTGHSENQSARINSLAIEPTTGKIIAAGQVFNSHLFGSDWDMAVWRFNSDGTPDLTFNSSGNTPGMVVHHDAAGGEGDDRGKSVVVDGSGNTIVAGESEGDSAHFMDLVVWRIRPDGSLDTNFNSAGFSVQREIAGGTSNPSPTSSEVFDTANAVTLDASGKILVTGASHHPSGRLDMVVLRLNADGTLDSTFNSSGFTTSGNLGADNYGNSVAIDSNGKITIAGVRTSTTSEMRVWRYNGDGTFDTSFSGTGHVVHNGDPSGNDAEGRGLAIDASGRLLITGMSRDNQGNVKMTTWRLNPDGTLDSSFNGMGFSVFHHSSSIRHLGNAIITDGSNGIWITGWTGYGNENRMTLWRYNQDGMLSLSVEQPVDQANPGSDSGNSLVIAPDGGILMGGVKESTDYVIRIWRYR